MFARAFLVLLVLTGVAAADPPQRLTQPAETSACRCPENDFTYAASINICFCDKAKRVRMYIGAHRAGAERELDDARPKKLCNCNGANDVCVCAAGQMIALTRESVDVDPPPPFCWIRTYDDAGHVLEHGTYDGRKLVQIFTTRYDAAGRRILDETRDADATLRSRDTFRYRDGQVQQDSDTDGDTKRDRTIVTRYDARGWRVGLDAWLASDSPTRCTYAKPCYPSDHCECSRVALPPGVTRPAPIVVK